MKIFLATLNWGLGHASRCVPLIERYCKQGHEVVIGGDGDSLIYLQRHFPTLRSICLAPLSMRYSAGKTQVAALLRATPRLVRNALQDHRLMQLIQDTEQFDLIISDNRFGLWCKQTRCVYITHQLHICLPRAWRFLEPAAERIHAWIYKHYDEVWVPDYQARKHSLAGDLSHPKRLPATVRYIGPLSRLALCTPAAHPQLSESYDIVAVLSGVEPQRSLYEQELIERFSADENGKKRCLLVRGKVAEPFTIWQHEHLIIVPWLQDEQLLYYVRQAEQIYSRSGYSSVMDIAALGLMDKTVFSPTPGQSEQEYLYAWLKTTASL